MVELYLLIFGPIVAGLMLALAWWLILGRKSQLSLGAAGGFALAGGLVALLEELAVRLPTVLFLLHLEVPTSVGRWFSDQRFTIPLMLGVLGIILLTFPIRSRRGQGTAELTRRTPLSFTRVGWLATCGVILTLVLAMTVAAGFASRPDLETGRYTEYWVEPGAQIGIGTQIYGWYYSIPALILMGVLVAIAALSLVLTARPGVAENRERDIRERTVRSRNILAGTTGALLLHLGVIFLSLHGTVSMRGSFLVTGGYLSVTPPFAAFGPAFFGAAILCAVLGVALWATAIFSAIPTRRRLSETNPS